MYKEAELEIVKFEVEDVILTSGGTSVVDPVDDWADVGGDTSANDGEK